MEEKDNKAIPLVLILEDLKHNLTDDINEAFKQGAPCYVVEMMLENLMFQIKTLSDNEIKIAKEGADISAPQG